MSFKHTRQDTLGSQECLLDKSTNLTVRTETDVTIRDLWFFPDFLSPLSNIEGGLVSPADKNWLNPFTLYADEKYKLKLDSL